LEKLLELDQSLFLLLNGAHADWLDIPMWLISTRWFWIPIYFFLLLSLFKRYKGWSFVVLLVIVALCITINDQVASGIFKEWVGRPRPTHTEGLKEYVHTVKDLSGNEYRGGRFGFYSSHAANLFGVVILFVVCMKPLKGWWIALLYLWVTLIAYSRIYLGVHFPGDILMGMGMGTLVGWICALIFLMINKRIKASL
jgi:undecaprenyl-diphosphatase